MKTGLLINFVNLSNLPNSKLLPFLLKCMKNIVEEKCVLIKESC